MKKDLEKQCLTDGQKLFIDNNGRILFRKTIVNGVSNGPEILFWASGKKRIERHHVNGMIHGENITYNESGEIVKIELYKNGIKVS